jgi:peroxiredoxin-like protein
MQDLPHRYIVRAAAAHQGSLTLDSRNLPHLENGAPAEFGGPGDLWSPETMLAGAVAGCFILTFRAVARASSLPWISIECPTEAVLERREGALQFTEFMLRPKITVSAGTSRERLQRIVQKAEKTCLIANSLRATIKTEPEIIEIDSEHASAAGS